jgi:hypothetical protein
VTRRARFALVGICLLAAGLSGRGLFDEGVASLYGDMPRYLMNGVFVHDLVRDMPVSDALGYAYRYYARYPALSIGHHPPLVALAEAPIFALAGVSVFGGRLTILLFLVLALVMWFRLVASAFGEAAAALASLLLATTPSVVSLSQEVMSEVPALALILGAWFYLVRYGTSDRRADLVGFAVCAVLSLYAKQVAVLMLPLYAAYAWLAMGATRVFSRRMVATAGIALVLMLPAILLTWWLSPFNLSVVTSGTPPPRPAPIPGAAPVESKPVDPGPPPPENFIESVSTNGRYLAEQTSVPALALALAAAAAAIVGRDRRLLVALAALVLFLVELSVLAYPIPRLSFHAVPGVCLLAAGLARGSGGWRRTAAIALVLAVVGYQTALSARITPVGAYGYEDAAREIVGRDGGVVLYSAVVDTGYFVFFVRKHDPAGRTIVLRADKLLTTSRMSILNVQNRIARPADIRALLREYGVRYVVLEDAGYPPGPLTWLQQEVATDAFALVRRIPLRSRTTRLRGVTMSVYEYREHGPARESATLDLDLPLIERRISVPMRDLIGGAAGR